LPNGLPVERFSSGDSMLSYIVARAAFMAALLASVIGRMW
jgi:hypothetical protein